MRRGDLFVLSWESLRRVEWGKVSSFLSMSGGGLFNSYFYHHPICHKHCTEHRSRIIRIGFTTESLYHI